MTRTMRSTQGPGAMTARATAPAQRIDIAPLLDHGRWSFFQKLILVLLCLVVVLDGVDAQVISLALPSIISDWQVDRLAFSPVLAASFLGMAAGNIFGGMIGDRFGRKWSLVGATLIFGTMTFAGSLTNDVPMFTVARVLASIGLGAALPNVTALLAEYTPLRRRSLALTISMCCLPVGGIVVGLVGAQILPYGGWRMLLAVAGLVPLGVALVIALMLPESIRFLVARAAGFTRPARILRRLGQRVDAGSTFVDSAEPEIRERAPVRAVLGPPYRHDTIFLSFAFFAANFATFIIFTWTPSLLSDAGYDLGISSAGMSAYGFGGLVGGVGCAALINRFGSRPPLIFMSIGGVIAALWLLQLPLGPSQVSTSVVMASMVLIGVFVPGTQAVIYALAAQVYPTPVRATGVGLAVAFGRLGAVASAFVAPPILAIGTGAFFATVAVAMALALCAFLAIRRHVLPLRVREAAPHGALVTP